MRACRVFTPIMCMAALTLSAGCGTPAVPKETAAKTEPVKIIHLGWNTPFDEYVRDNAGEMETWHPFIDGVIIELSLRGECEAKGGKQHQDVAFSWVVFGKGKVQWENVSEAVDNLKAGAKKFTRTQEMFARFNIIPGNVDWYDDEGWEGILHNAAMAGSIIREAELKGMFFDIEEYGEAEFGQGRPFTYSGLRHSGEKSFDEYAAQARKRGREFIDAFQKEAPRAMIIFAWANGSFGWQEHRERKAGERGPDERLTPEEVGSLLAPFIDGIVENSGDGINLYDGCEAGYYCHTESDFRRLREFAKDGYHYSQVPELYKKKMKVSFGIYPDLGWGKRDGFYPDNPEKNVHSPKGLADALHSAMRYSDGYIWIYTECIYFWPQNENWGPKYARAFEEARKEKPFGVAPR